MNLKTEHASKNNAIPMVSISCITYNHKNYIRDAIEGFLIQKTTFPFEILIHDDASTDGTSDIIKEYENKYPGLIKPVYQKQNQYSKGVSISATFNWPRAKGKYIALCEGDDYWTDPLKLQKQVEFLEGNEGFGLVYSDVDFYFQDKKTFQRSVFQNGYLNRVKSFEDHLLNKGFLAPCTWLVRYEKFPVLTFNHSDGTFALMLEIFKKTKVHYINEVMAVYRANQGSASRPSNDKAIYLYHRGLLVTQKYYAEKYKVDQVLKDKIYSNAYINLLKKAVLYSDTEFIEEAKNYFFKKGIEFQPLIDLCNELNFREKEIQQKSNSYAYQIGKTLVRPFSYVKRRFSRNTKKQ